jgi:hypothetical protein
MTVRAIVGLLALGSVAVAACTTTEIRQVPVPGSSGGTPGEDAGVDPEADSGPDPYADGGSLSDAVTKPSLPVPTMFKRTLDCTRGACSGGLCTGNQTSNCTLTTPCEGKESGIRITSVTDFPLKIKTPALTGADPACGRLCGPGDSTAYAISIQLETPGTNLPIAIKVPAPWRVSAGEDRYRPVYCTTAGLPRPIYPDKDCLAYYGSGNATFVIVTSDPNAPSVDVSVELLSVGDWPTQLDGQCPY